MYVLYGSLSLSDSLSLSIYIYIYIFAYLFICIYIYIDIGFVVYELTQNQNLWHIYSATIKAYTLCAIVTINN